MKGQLSLASFSDPVRAVFDTNTVMALWHFHDPTLVHIAAAIGTTLIPVVRPDCAAEFRRVLAYEQFAIAPEAQAALADAYGAACTEVNTVAPAGLPRCTDEDDQKFLELAVSADAALLITRDKALLRLARHRALQGRLIIISPERIVP